MFFLTNLKKGGVLELNILMLLAISMRFFAVHVDIFFKDSKKNHTSSAEYGTDFSLSLSLILVLFLPCALMLSCFHVCLQEQGGDGALKACLALHNFVQTEPTHYYLASDKLDGHWA